MNKSTLVTVVFISSLFGMGTVHADSELSQAIQCKGSLKSAGGLIQTVRVEAVPATNTLDITISTGKPTGPFDTQKLPIVEVRPMFPTYTIMAKQDKRPVDGFLTEALLSIRNEVITINKKQTAKLTLSKTAPRGGHSSTVYSLTCSFSRH